MAIHITKVLKYPRKSAGAVFCHNSVLFIPMPTRQFRQTEHSCSLRQWQSFRVALGTKTCQAIMCAWASEEWEKCHHKTSPYVATGIAVYISRCTLLLQSKARFNDSAGHVEAHWQCAMKAVKQPFKCVLWKWADRAAITWHYCATIACLCSQ